MILPTLQGFLRTNGQVGIRNHVLVIPTVICSAAVCERICEEVAGCVTFSHQHGCSQIGSDAEQTYRVLLGMGLSPNVGAVLILSLGCEVVDGERLTQEIAATEKPTAFLRIQEVGGSVKAIEKGIELARHLQDQLREQKRERTLWSKMRIAIKWGSGAHGVSASEQTVKQVVDTLLTAGASVLLGETEKWGSPLSLAERRLSGVGERRLIEVEEAVNFSATQLSDSAATVQYPDVFDHAWVDELKYGQCMKRTGFQHIDTPVSDVECLTGYAAAGAHATLFFVEGGSSVGNPVMPVCKIQSPGRAGLWEDEADFSLGSMDEDAEGILQSLAQILSGDRAVAELLGHEEFAIHRIGPSL